MMAFEIRIASSLCAAARLCAVDCGKENIEQCKHKCRGDADEEHPACDDSLDHRQKIQKFTARDRSFCYQIDGCDQFIIVFYLQNAGDFTLLDRSFDFVEVLNFC